MDKKLFLLLLCAIVASVALTGCMTPRAPEGIDDDLWQDSVKVAKIIYTTYKNDNNFTVDDENIVNEYFDTYKNRAYDNTEERELIKDISGLYKQYDMYVVGKRVFGEDDIVTNEHRVKVEEVISKLENNYQNILK